MRINIAPGDVIDRYLQVIPKAAQLAEGYLQTVQNAIASQELAVHVTRQEAASGFFGALGKDKREVLVIVPLNSALGDYTLYQFGVPSGSNLAVGWYLAKRGAGVKGLMQAVGSAHRALGGLGAAAGMHEMFGALDMFEIADLEAILTAIHQFAVMDAVYAVATRVNFDQKRISSKSAGFFGIG